MADIREQVSGTGSMSKRTDLNVSQQPARYISGMPYGEGQATYNQQTAMPMAKASGPETLPANFFGQVTPITAASEYPDEPITAGVDFGPGPGSEMLPAAPRQSAPSLINTFKQLVAYDQSGDAELIYRRLLDEGF